MWTINELKDWDNLRRSFSWIQEMEGIPQDSIYHQEGDVATHTRMVMEALLSLPSYNELREQEQEILLAAVLLHDVEKRSTTLLERNGRISSRGHARKGEYTARRILYRDRPAPFAIKEQVAKLVRLHGLPLWVFEKPNPQKALLQASLEVDTRLLSILATADVLGRICDDQQKLLEDIELFAAYCQEQQCWGQARAFASNLGRYQYFQKEEASPDYEPFEKGVFEVILLSALPGTGKDHYVKTQYPDWPVVSLDNLRRKHKIAPTDKKGNGQIIQLVKEEARVYLRKKQSFIWNATNISRNMRTPLVDLFQSYGAKTRIVYLEVPYAQLFRQNREREYAIPTKVLERMIDKLEVPALWEAPEVEWLVTP